jgi:hypothetical protein
MPSVLDYLRRNPYQAAEKIALSRQFVGWLSYSGVFELLRRDLSCYRALERSVSRPFRDTTAQTDYAGTVPRIKFRMRTRL